MPIETDFSVTRSNGNIRAVAGTENYTVLELHRWLSDLADDASSVGDDELDITDDVASDKAFDTIITLLGSYNIDDATAERLYGGSITQGSGGSLVRYSGVQINGSFPAGSPQIIQNNVKLTNFWGNSYNPDSTLGVSHQFLVKTTDAGSEIDGGRARGQYRVYDNQFREASTVLGVGVSVIALGNIQPDPFNNVTLANVQLSPYTTVANNSEGYNLINLNNENGPQPYYSNWDPNSTDLAGLYNRVKFLTRDGTSDTLYGLNCELFRGVTHEIDIDGGSGTWNAFEPISWPGGTGQMLAIDDTTATSATVMWIQLLTGVAPSDNDTITGDTSAATNDVDVTVTGRVLGVNSVIGDFFGTVIGAFGVGIDATYLTAADSLTDLLNVIQTPPNNVPVSVLGVEGGVSDQDYVLLGRRVGGSLEKDRYTADGAQLAASATYTVNEAIDTDNPASGFVRIFDAATNSYGRVAYDSYSGSVFTLSTNIGFDVGDAANSFVPFLDNLASGGTLGDEDGSISTTVVYSSDIDVIGSVRNGNTSTVSPIKPFPLSGQIGSGGFSVTAVRQSDA